MRLEKDKQRLRRTTPSPSKGGELDLIITIAYACLLGN